MSGRRQTSEDGVILVRQVVNDHGSIFRELRQQDDFGIDAYIEFLGPSEGRRPTATGELVAVQIKSGESYLNAARDEFVVTAPPRHRRYWSQYAIPVVLVCCLPRQRRAAWTQVTEPDDVDLEHPRTIRVPLRNEFTPETLGTYIRGIARAARDRRGLLDCANKTLDRDPGVRLDAIKSLANHPSSRELRVTALLARRLVGDPDENVAREAAYALGFAVAHRKWSFNPNSDLMWFAHGLCGDLAHDEVRSLLALVRDMDFGGMSLGEAVADCIGCMWAPDAENSLWRVARDESQPMYVRANALFLLSGMDWGELSAGQEYLEGEGLGGLLAWMRGDGADGTPGDAQG